MKKLLFLPLIIAFGMVVLVGGTYASSTGWEELDDTEEELGTGIEGTLKSSPTASPVAGTYTSSQSVTLSTDGASSIRYTTNGSTPTCSSTEYSSAISVSSTTTIKAISCYPGDESSDVASFTYTINTSTGSPGGGGGGSRDSDDDDDEDEGDEEATDDDEETEDSEEDEDADEESDEGSVEERISEKNREIERIRGEIDRFARIREMTNNLLVVAVDQGNQPVETGLNGVLEKIRELEERANREMEQREEELRELEESTGTGSSDNQLERIERIRATIETLIPLTEGDLNQTLQGLGQQADRIRERIQEQL
jgi:hypothetical protein